MKREKEREQGEEEGEIEGEGERHFTRINRRHFALKNEHRALTTTIFMPFWQARCRGVVPLWSGALTSAPCFIKISTTSV